MQSWNRNDKADSTYSHPSVLITLFCNITQVKEMVGLDRRWDNAVEEQVNIA